MPTGLPMSSQILVREISVILSPLADAVSEPARLVTYSRSIGYEIDLAQAEHILAELEPETTALTESFELASANGIDASSASATGLAAQGLLSALARQISLAVGNDAKQGDIYEDVFYSLLRLYLGARVPFAVALLQALGVMSEPNTPVDPGAQPPIGGGKVTFDWARLADFIQNTNHWALDIYGWGGTDASSQRFDHIHAMARIAKLVEMLQIATTHLRPLTAAESLALLGPQATDGALRVDLPLFQANFSKVDPDGEPLFDTELGLSLLPFSDPSNRGDHGFAISPYALGATTIDQSLSDGVRLAVSVEADIQAGARPLLAITPRGWRSLSLDTTGHLSVVPSLHVQVDASLSYTKGSGPMWVIGSESGSRVQSAGTRFSVRVSTPGEIVASVSALDVQVVVDLSEDRLLKSFLVRQPYFVT